jgi:hypothetical protein
MQRQALAAAAILCLIGGTSGSIAGKDQMVWSDILTIAEQTMQNPVFGARLGKLTAATPESLAKELPDDRFVADQFPPPRLIFPDGTQEPEPNGPYTVVRVLKVLSVLRAYATPVPLVPGAGTSTPVAVEDSVGLFDYRLLFDQRRVKEWERQGA